MTKFHEDKIKKIFEKKLAESAKEGRRFFHPALTIDREHQEVLIGISTAEPTFEKNKYKINEKIQIVTNKGEIWPLVEEQMETRNLFPRGIPSFGINESRWSPTKMVTPDFEAKTDQSDLSDHEKGGRVDPYKEVFLPIKTTLDKFIDFNNPNYSTLVALWILGTYLFPIFDAYPYLYLGGNPNSGKSKVLDLLYKLTFNPVNTSNSSPSSLFRTIENTLATILLDEGESLTGRESNPDLRLLFNAGYKSTGVVTRTNPENLKVEQFRVYSPKAIAAINLLDQTLATRCISIIMLKTANKTIGQSKVNDRSADWSGLRNKLYCFTLQHALEVAKVFDLGVEELELNNRNFELFSPLIAIATYLDKFSGEDLKLAQVVLKTANELIQEEDLLDEWTLWVLEALDEVVKDYRPYLVKDIKKTIAESRAFENESLDEHLNNKWIGACLKKFGFKRGKPTNEGKTYLIKREQVESLKERYGLIPPTPLTTVTMVTKDIIEAKSEGDHKSEVTIVSDLSDQELNRKIEDGILWLEDNPNSPKVAQAMKALEAFEREQDRRENPLMVKNEMTGIFEDSKLIKEGGET